MTSPTLHVLDTPARAVGELLAAAARAGATIVLTGGSSAGEAYEHAAALESDWSEAAVWWGDERCVPPEDERSKYGLGRSAPLSWREMSWRGSFVLGVLVRRPN